MSKIFLFLFITFSLGSNGQTINSKKEIDSFLKSIPKGAKVEIKVTSSNQKGGQTALFINNYYGDTTKKITPQENIGWELDSFNGIKGISVFPIEGKWDNPFVTYPECWLITNESKDFIGGNFANNYYGQTGTQLLEFYGKKYKCIFNSYNKPCYTDEKLFIPLESGNLGFFLVGDNYDRTKQYIFNFGEIKYFPDFKKSK